MNSKIISLAKNKLKDYLRDKEVLDIVLFGSSVKGATLPRDIDVAIITNEELKLNIKGFHIILLKPVDFIENPSSIITTIFREGYSLKNNKSFSENYRFSNKVLFTYELFGLKASEKVKIVNILRGKKGEKGVVEENKGEWLANQVFLISIENEKIIEKIFLNFKVKFKKFHVLIH